MCVPDNGLASAVFIWASTFIPTPIPTPQVRRPKFHTQRCVVVNDDGDELSPRHIARNARAFPPPVRLTTGGSP
jgi:hypothetical protein